MEGEDREVRKKNQLFENKLRKINRRKFLKISTIVGGSLITGWSVFSILKPVTAFGFTDVEAGHWAEIAISYLQNQGIIEGYPDGSFRPNRYITRAEFSKIIVLASGASPSVSYRAYFSDVTELHWAWSYIGAAAELGLASGYPGGFFRPDNIITRGEVAKLVVQAAGYTLDQTTEHQFSDLSSSHWAYYHIITLVNRNILEGYPDGTFRPNAGTTRAEAAKIIYEWIT
jgi:hypothetical protein